jgi:hypothetical protein
MKLFVQKVIILLTPFILFGLLMVLIDPYNYFNVSKIIDDQVKLETSYRLDNSLWKVIEYNRKPVPNILLGDSRIEGIDVNKIEEITGEKYYNFAYGGGTLPEVIDTFWYAAQKNKLKNVYIGINFNLYNFYISWNRFSPNSRLLKSPFLYVFNLTVINAFRYNIYRQYLNKIFKIGNPPFNKEEFWKYQIEVNSLLYYRKFKYADIYTGQLTKVVNYCQEKKINLTFIIPPTHIDLQNQITTFNLAVENRKFIRDLKTLGTIFDFDYPNDFTKNKDNFLDPYHCLKEINPIIPVVWGHQQTYVKISNPEKP